MVGYVHPKLTIFVLFGMLFAPGATRGDVTCTTLSIRIQNRSEWQISAAQPIAVAFEVEAECKGLASNKDERLLARHVGRALSERVVLDGVVYGNRLSEGMVNEIVAFEPTGASGQTFQNKEVAESIRRTFTYVGNIFIIHDKANRAFVFETPGQHTIVFGAANGPQADLTVIVAAPTPIEKRIIEELHEHDLLITLAMSDDCSAYSRPRLMLLRQLLEQARGTSCEKLLAVAVGVGSMCEIQQSHIVELEKTLARDPVAQVDRSSFEEKLLPLAQFFEHAITSEINSEFDIVALARLAELRILRAKRAVSQAEMEVYVSEFKRISERIAASPVASYQWLERFRVQATQAEQFESAFRQP